MTNDKDPKNVNKNKRKIIKKKAGEMGFLVYRRNVVIDPGTGPEKNYQTKSTGPKSQLVEKDE